MSDDEQSKHLSEADAELEREIREGRKFTLEEAIARMAGPGAMKGESPVTRNGQAEAEIDNLAEATPDRCWRAAWQLFLHRRVKGSELLLENFDQPLVVLASYAQQVLDSDYLAERSCSRGRHRVGTCDGERPHFEKEGSTASPGRPVHDRVGSHHFITTHGETHGPRYIRQHVRSCFTILSGHSVCLAQQCNFPFRELYL